MKRRIFISIDLPPELKEKISEAIKQWQWLPIRWLKPENWHITLVPPMYLDDEEAGSLATLLKSSKIGKPFAVNFSRVALAPPGRAGRMIWLEGQAPKELAGLKNRLEDLLAGRPHFYPVRRESRPLALHATLARFQPGDLAQLQEKIRVLGEFKASFRAGEISIMESHLRPGGAEYETLAAIPLGS